MSTKMARRRRHDRRKRILTERRENSLFYGRGTFPASGHGFAICSCGARAFTRDPHGDLTWFDEAHTYCDEAAA